MPISRKDSFTIQVLLLTDALLVWFAIIIGGELRDVVRAALDMTVLGESVLDSMRWMLFVAVPITPLLLERFGFYDRIRQKPLRSSMRQLFQTLLVLILIIGLIAVFSKQIDARRLIVGIGLIFVFLLLLARDRLTHRWLKSRVRDEAAKERIIVAGTDGEMDSLLAELDPEITSDWHIVSHFDLGSRPVEDLFFLLKNEAVERVLFVARHTEFEKVAAAVEACELQGVEAWISASFIRTQIARPVFDVIGNKPMLVLRSTPELSWELMFKEIFDRVMAALLILLSSPFWLAAYLGIRFSSPGAPVFFSQMRAGRYGKPFRMWKFRTMVANAEQLLQKIKDDHGNEMQGPVFKLDRDPRIFPFGALLRRFSIDELPQLINVVLGNMSLVGPRPLPLYEVEAFCEISHRRRLSVKPGITCEWQAGGRNHITSFEEWVKMDLRYIDNWSLWLDFRILLRTIPAVLFAKGAK
jgi:exopolysaccharide biosynthesis polyprenyl glycosylphosphotransferase